MEMLCFGVMIGLIVAMVVFGCGVEYGVHQRKHDGDCDNGVHSSVGGSDDPDSLGNIQQEKPDRRDLRMDSETALIALESVRQDLSAMISCTERTAIDYAIESIEIREKVETWLEEKEKEYEHIQ